MCVTHVSTSSATTSVTQLIHMCDIYTNFQRHDGTAVTCDDFRAAMADANNADLAQFERWYTQAGTPIVKVEKVSQAKEPCILSKEPYILWKENYCCQTCQKCSISVQCQKSPILAHAGGHARGRKCVMSQLYVA